MKTMQFSVRAIVLSAFLVGSLLIIGLPSARAEGESSVDNSRIIATFDELGVKSEYRDALLDKINSGGTVDSETDAEPISVETEIVNGESVSRSEFADGSVSVTSVELPEPASTTPGGVVVFGKPSVSGCHAIANKDGWKRRTDCLVQWKSTTIGFAFQANYSVKSGAGRVDSVKSRGDLTYNNTPGRKITSQVTKVGRKTSTSSMYAWGQTYVKTEIANITKTWYLEIRVKGSAWATNWA